MSDGPTKGPPDGGPDRKDESTSDDAPWYRRWFGDDYLDLYPHRDQEEADRGVELLRTHASLAGGSRVLDLACGAGRHLAGLRSLGLRPVGLDLSRPLLLRAREIGPGLPLVRGDMRSLPFADGSFDAVASYFTSFGYFADASDDSRVLREVRRVLVAGGVYLLDFLNAARVRRTLSPRDEGNIEGRRVLIERRIVEERYVEKSIRFPEASREAGKGFKERVRLYEPEELEDLLRAEALVPERRFGNYGGAPFRDSSPRVIVLARAA